MKIDEIGVAGYNFGSAGIKCVMNVSYDMPSQSKLFFLFQGLHLYDKLSKNNKCLNQGFFCEITKALRLCLNANFLDYDFVVAVRYSV